MISILKKFIKDSITVANGEDFDIGRILWALGVLVFLGLSIYSVVKNTGHTFDAQAFGAGLGLVLAGGGAALGFKSKTEPGDKP